MTAVEFPDFVLRVIFAGLCGLVIGLDRRIKHKPLGARAYILIALGSSALMVVMVNFSLSPIADDDSIQIDPAKVIQGIVGGIGFLGGGAIIKNEDHGRLRGAASGAAIWAVGAVGVACGMGYLKEAAFLAMVIFAILGLPSWLGAAEDGRFDKNAPAQTKKGDQSSDSGR